MTDLVVCYFRKIIRYEFLCYSQFLTTGFLTLSLALAFILITSVWKYSSELKQDLLQCLHKSVKLDCATPLQGQSEQQVVDICGVQYAVLTPGPCQCCSVPITISALFLFHNLFYLPSPRCAISLIMAALSSVWCRQFFTTRWNVSRSLLSRSSLIGSRRWKVRALRTTHGD